MIYTAYSFVALSRLRHGKRAPHEEENDARPLSDALRLTGSARISGIGPMVPWYVRLFRRMLGRPAARVVNDRFEFELAFKVNPLDRNAGFLDLRSQLGLMQDVKRAVIEVFVIQDEERATRIDPAEKLPEN